MVIKCHQEMRNASHPLDGRAGRLSKRRNRRGFIGARNCHGYECQTVVDRHGTASGLVAAPALAQEEPIKVGVLHSLSGTMAISETTLKDVMLMLIEEQNAKGGVLGRPLEAVVVDPASDWPLFAELARELIDGQEVDVVFGCWTSRQPQVGAAGLRGAELDPVLPGAVRGPGEPAQRLLHRRGAQPAGDPGGRLPDERGGRRALGAGRHRLRLSAHDQPDPRGVPEGEGRRRRGHHDQLHAVRAFRLADDRLATSRPSARRARRPRSSRRSTATPTCPSTRSSATRASRPRTSPSWPSRSARRSSPASTRRRWSATSRPGTTS